MRFKFVFLLMLGIALLEACQNDASHENHKTEGNSYYTCPMHPNVKSDSPGACPVCNMSLVKVEQSKDEHEGHERKGNFITLNARQQLLAGIETDTVQFQNIISSSVKLGKVVIDEEQVTTVSSRVKGRIDRLYVRSWGTFVKKGDPIYAIYSEELLADEKEYRSLIKRKNEDSVSNRFLENMLDASKNKLLLWGLSNKQISDLSRKEQLDPLVVYYAPTGGYVSDLEVSEGMYVEEGSPVMRLAGLKDVWVEAQIYTDEITEGNSTFQIMSESSPETTFEGKLVYNTPVLEDGRKIQLLRIRVKNEEYKLIPGMMVYVSPDSESNSVLTVPKSALLLEKMKTVWVKTDMNTFEQRMVTTGVENKEWVEIRSGLKEGELVVSSGAYLINSEFVLKKGGGQRHDH